jgi:hypothetical protein
MKKTQCRICQFTLICSKNWNFQQYPPTSNNHYSRTIYHIRECKYSLERFQNYLSLFILCIFPDSVPFSVSRALRDHCQSESEVVSNILPLGHYVPMIITSSLFIIFERMSNEWKVEKVNCEFDFGGFLRWYLDWTQKFTILRSLKSDQPRISAVQSTSK